MMLVALALATFVVAGLTFGWLSWFRVRDLERRLDLMQRELKLLRLRLNGEAASSASPGPSPAPSDADLRPGPVPGRAAPAEPAERPVGAVASAGAPWPAAARAMRAGRIDDRPPAWLEALKAHWMVWLGGACVGLAGIFLVSYSIEQGLLGPRARLASGLLLGLGLHVAAEWLRRRRGAHPAFAALAGGGSVTLFASLLAALHLYELVAPGPAFVLLALVALATMALALAQGPVLAGLGLLGAYLVPLLAGGGPGAAGIVLVYALIISAAALLLLRYIFRLWLWGGILAGALAWWLLTLWAGEADSFRGLYLAAFAWLLLALPRADWLLTQRESGSANFLQVLRETGPGAGSLLPLALLALIAAQALSIVVQGFDIGAPLNWLPLAALLLWGGGRREPLETLPWLLLGAQAAALVTAQLEDSARGVTLGLIAPEAIGSFLLYCVLSALLYSALALWNFLRERASGLWLSLAALAPLLFLALAYVLASPRVPSLQWSLLALLAGALYLALAGWSLTRTAHRPASVLSLWLTVAGHAGYSLAVAFQFREAGLTLALAMQMLSLAWVIRRFEQPGLGWILKGVAVLVVLRLSLNPWLLAYPEGVHWSLWTYGGSTLCCLGAAILLAPYARLRQWAFGAALHLFTLSVWVELRWFLHDGGIYTGGYSFTEAAINAALFGALAFVYRWRERFSEILAPLYRVYACILLVFALLNYALILWATAVDVPWVHDAVGERPLFNLMLLAYGAPVVLGLLGRRWAPPAFARRAGAFSAAAALIFVTLEIRHLWQGNLDLDAPASHGELYSYSAAWLVLAVAAILGGAWRLGRDCYRAGMALLVVVIAKLFLVDMAGLEGLFRVASFMGMGLGLLAIAYLHQRLGKGPGGKAGFA